MKNKFKTPDPKKARRYFARKLAFTAGVLELSSWLKVRKDIKIVDVRDAKSYAKGHLPRALHLPEDRWLRAGELAKTKTYIIYGESRASHLAARAALSLATSGLPVMELDGGFEAWRQAGKTVEKGIPRKPARKKPASVKQPAVEETASSPNNLQAPQAEEVPVEAVSAVEAN